MSIEFKIEDIFDGLLNWYSDGDFIPRGLDEWVTKVCVQSYRIVTGRWEVDAKKLFTSTWTVYCFFVVVGWEEKFQVGTENP